MNLSPRTRVFAILGDPVSHSLSPRFQNAAIRAAGIDAVYLALRCDPEQLAPLISLLSENGGGGNVTVPHKGLAASAGKASPLVTTLGVANTFVGSAGEVVLENTDVAGVLHALTRLAAPPTRWLICGTGGAARAAIGAARESGAAVAIQSRSLARATELQALASSLGVVATEPESCEVAINATPLGLNRDDPLPLDLRQFPRLRWVFDMVYRPTGETLWVQLARSSGCHASDGREMLLAQGAASWQLWFPGIIPSLEVMRAALRG